MPRITAGIDGGVTGQMALITKVLWLVSPTGSTDAVLVVRGSDSSYAGSLIFSGSCDSAKPGTGVFVRNQWRAGGPHGGSRDDCLIVAGPMELGSVMRRGDPAVVDLLQARGGAMSGPGYGVRVTIRQGGTYLAAMLYVAKPFKGSSRPVTVDPGAATIPGPVLQWGADLSDALRSSVDSWSGKFTLPPIEFGPGSP